MTAARKGILSYLAIAFGGAWIAWEIPIRLGIAVTSPLFQISMLPGAFAPALAAIVVRMWVTREGFGDAGLAIEFRKWRFYVVAWLLPLAVLLAIAAESTLLGIGTPDFSIQSALHGMHREPSASLLPYMGILIFPQLLFNAVITTPLLWGEEFGWRGYLQPRLFPGRPLRSAAATGIIWAVWHYPLILRGYNYPDHPWLGLLMFPVTCFLLSLIFGWLRARSGSVWAAGLAHAATNVIGGTLSLLWYYGVASQTLVGYQGILAWPPLIALCIWIVASGQLRPRITSPPTGMNRPGAA